MKQNHVVEQQQTTTTTTSTLNGDYKVRFFFMIQPAQTSLLIPSFCLEKQGCYPLNEGLEKVFESSYYNLW